MKKSRIATISAFVGLGLVFVAPWVMGFFVRSKVDNVVVQLNANIVDSGVQVYLEGYQRGWFSSTAQLMMHAESVSADLNIPLTQNTVKIWHGPVLFDFYEHWLDFGIADVEGTIGASGYFSAIFTMFDTKIPTIRTHGVIGFDDSFQGAFDVSSMRLSKGGVKVDWGGMFGDYVITKMNERFNLNLETAPLSLVYGKTKEALSKVVFSLKLLETPQPYLKDVNLHLRIDSAKVVNDDLTSFALQSGACDVRSFLLKDQFSIDVAASADAVEFDESEYAPVGMKLFVNKLDAAGANAFFAELKPARDQGELMSIRSLSSLIGNGTNVSLEYLTIGFPEGLAQMKANIVWPTKPVSASIADVMSASLTELYVSVPVVTVQKYIDGSGAHADNATEKISAKEKQEAREQLALWIKDGVVVENNGFYEVKLAGVGQSFKLNGKDVNDALKEKLSNRVKS